MKVGHGQAKIFSIMHIRPVHRGVPVHPLFNLMTIIASVLFA